MGGVVDHLADSFALDLDILVSHVLLDHKGANALFHDLVLDLLLVDALKLSLDVPDVFLIFGAVHGQFRSRELGHSLDLGNYLDFALSDSLVLEDMVDVLEILVGVDGLVSLHKDRADESQVV